MLDRSKLQIVAVAIAILVLLANCSSAKEDIDPAPIAKAVAEGVGATKISRPGNEGPPIFILEENHSSRLAALEEAVILERLRGDHKIQDIGLEGLIVSEAGPPQKTRLPIDRALAMLEAGEISSAEFAQLTQGMKIHAIEVKSEYFHPDDQSAVAPLVYLLNIATASLESKARNNRLDSDMSERIRKLESELQNGSDEDKERKISEFQQALLEWDPWTRKIMRQLKRECGDDVRPIDEEISLLEAIEARAKVVGAEIEPPFRNGMQTYKRFLTAREASSITMVNRIAEIAQTSDSGVAMIIGAAHTEKVAQLLSEQRRPFAVITPLAMVNCDGAEATDSDSYERLIRGLPAADGILETALTTAFPVEIKPKPVSAQTWFQARAELINLTDRFVAEVQAEAPGGAGGAGGPPKGPSIPTGGNSERWHGELVLIDVKRAVLARDDINGEVAVVFPVILNPKNPAQKQELWIRASLASSATDKPSVREIDDVQEVEKPLLAAIKHRRNKSEPPAEPAKGVTREKGIADVSRVLAGAGDTKIFMAKSKKAVMFGMSEI